jgi:hypothetical protein
LQGSHLDPEPIGRIQEGLAFARAHRWRVVGFSAPFSPGTTARLRRDPRSAALLRVFDRAIPPLFAREHFPFVNLLERAARVSCTDADYLRHDGAHMNEKCANRVRIALERAALTMH